MREPARGVAEILEKAVHVLSLDERGVPTVRGAGPEHRSHQHEREQAMRHLDRHQRLEARVVAEVARVELAVRGHHPAEVTRAMAPQGVAAVSIGLAPGLPTLVAAALTAGGLVTVAHALPLSAGY